MLVAYAVACPARSMSHQMGENIGMSAEHSLVLQLVYFRYFQPLVSYFHQIY
jgi:hypothetical protein